MKNWSLLVLPLLNWFITDVEFRDEKFVVGLTAAFPVFEAIVVVAIIYCYG